MNEPNNIFREILASVVVFLVALPLCMGIAIASGAPPAAGLVSGIIGGLIVGFLAGSPLQVSGPAAGLAVIVYEIINTQGYEVLGPMMMVAGIVQIIAGRFKVGQWFRAISPAVIYGMLSGIGVLIFASQVHVMVDTKPGANGLTNLVTIPQAIMKGLDFSAGSPHHLAAGVGLVTLLVLLGWNAIKDKFPSWLALMPAPLLAVIAGVAVAQAMGLNIQYVEVPASFNDMIQFPTTAGLQKLLDPSILGSSVALGIIASTEALLCAMAVDKLHDGVRSNLDKELSAQGLGNLVAGLVGALPITGVIVRSTANIEAGSKNRLSAIIHGFWLLVAVGLVPFLLEMIPVASLAAILVYIGYKLFRPQVAKSMIEKGKGEAFVYFVTVFAIVATNLLDGLLIGFVLAVIKLAWGLSNIGVELDVNAEVRRVDVQLTGCGTFVAVPKLAQSLKQVPWSHEVHVHIDRLEYMDHACIELLAEWKNEYNLRGGEVIIEWDDLTKMTVAPNQKAA